MSNRTKWIIGTGVVGVIAAIAIVYFFFLGGADDPVSLEEAVAAATSTTAASPDDTTAETTAETTAPTSTAGGEPQSGLDGSWAVTTDLDSFVGYRVQEDLDPIGNTTATGRTRVVSGTLEIAATSITAVAIDADVSQLASDRGTRDRALRSRGLESDSFPQATFNLTAPIDLGEVPAVGEPFAATAQGDLTAHGVTNAVEVALEAQLLDETTIAVVGTIPVKLSDFEISGLTGFAVLSVEDEAEVEFQLFFSR